MCGKFVLSEHERLVEHPYGRVRKLQAAETCAPLTHFANMSWRRLSVISVQAGKARYPRRISVHLRRTFNKSALPKHPRMSSV